MSSPGGNDLTIGIGANAADFQQGMNSAAQSMNSFAQSVNQNTALLVQNFAQLNTAFATFSNNWQALNTAQVGFQAQTQNTASAVKDNLIGGFTNFAFSVNQTIQFLGNMKDILGGVTDLALKLPSLIMSIPMNFLTQNGMLPSGGIGGIADAGLNEAWNLNVSTQKTRTGWGYIFGGGGQMGTGALAGQVIDPTGTAEQMMLWSSQASMKVPFTRQDLISAMTSLGLTNADAQGGHLTAAQVEQYMPYVSDIAATYGSPSYGGKGVTLTQAAQAIRATSMGLTRMLKYELNINPEDLIAYGLDATGSGVGMHINDPSTLLPALQKFAIAKGISGGTNDSQGASMMMEQGTWQGAWSSFQDRVQNFLLQAGGTSLNGDVRQGSLLSNMQNSLTSLTTWMDQPNNMAALLKWADVIQNSLGGGAKIAANAIQGLFTGMQQSGAGNVIFDGLKSFGDWINSPQTAQALQNIGAAIGQFTGPVLQTAEKSVQGFLAGFAASPAIETIKTELVGLGTWFADKQHQQDIADFFNTVGGAIGNMVSLMAQATTWLSQQVQNAQNPGNNNQMKNLIVNGINTNSDQYDWDNFIKTIPLSQLKPGAKAYDANMAALQAYFAKLVGENNLPSGDVSLLIQRFIGDLQKGYTSDVSHADLDAYLKLLEQNQGGTAAIAKMTPAQRAAAVKSGALLPQSAELARQQAAQARADAAAAVAASTPSSGPALGSPDAAALTAQATSDSQKYIDAFHKQFQQANVGNTLVTTLTTQFQTGLQSNSGAFAQAMTTAMTNIAQQVVTGILQQMATSTNTAARVAGGKTSPYAPGVS